MQDSGKENFMCPSFNNFGYISEIAAKISDEFKAEEENDIIHGGATVNGEEEDFDFEFYPEFSVSTVEFVYEGQSKFNSIFPVFNRDLLLNDKNKVEIDSSIRNPLKNLFLDERELETTSSSVSDVDDLETIPPGTYCVWKPKISESASSSPIKCKKSKSTGSVSKKWKIRDLLRRSNSDRKDNSSFVFLTPKKGTKIETSTSSKGKDSGAIVKAAGKLKQSPAAAAHQALYGRNRTGYEVDKNRRKSYLPYRQDLIGYFATVNGLNRIASRPF